MKMKKCSNSTELEISLLLKKIDDNRLEIYKLIFEDMKGFYEYKKSNENYINYYEAEFDFAIMSTINKVGIEKCKLALKEKLLEKKCSGFVLDNDSRNLMMYKFLNKDLKYFIVKTIYSKYRSESILKNVINYDSSLFVLKDLFDLFDDEKKFFSKYDDIMSNSRNFEIVVDEFLEIRFLEDYDFIFNSLKSDLLFNKNIKLFNSFFGFKESLMEKFLKKILKRSNRFYVNDKVNELKQENSEIIKSIEKLEKRLNNINIGIEKELKDKCQKNNAEVLKKLSKREKEIKKEIENYIMNNLDNSFVKSRKIDYAIISTFLSLGEYECFNAINKKIFENDDSLFENKYVIKDIDSNEFIRRILHILSFEVFEIFNKKVTIKKGSAVEIIFNIFSKQYTEVIFKEFDKIFKDSKMVNLFIGDYFKIRWLFDIDYDVKYSEVKNDINYNSLIKFVDEYCDRKNLQKL